MFIHIPTGDVDQLHSPLWAAASLNANKLITSPNQSAIIGPMSLS